MDLKKYLAQKATVVEKALQSFLPKDDTLIAKAMRYSIMAGGKRLRPILVMEGAELCGLAGKEVLPAACALEYIHTYSLIHDDLPAMDNDDLRRGKPTSHKKFGEATAILAGDALLTEAFRLMADCAKNKKVSRDGLIVAGYILSTQAGYKGMIGGQVIDTVEAGSWKKLGKKKAAEVLTYIHLNKTAALLRASLTIGAELAGGTEKQVMALDSYGRNIGLAFQIADDILDIVGDKKKLGKRGSDRDNDKLTWPALYGLESSRATARELVEKAKKDVAIFGKRSEALVLLADYIVNRDH